MKIHAIEMNKFEFSFPQFREYMNNKFPTIKIYEPTLDILNNIKDYLIQHGIPEGGIDQFHGMLKFDLNGYLTYIHEMNEINLLEQKGFNWRDRKSYEYNPCKKRIKDLHCHCPSVMIEAHFLNELFKIICNKNILINDETMAFYNPFTPTNTVVFNQDKLNILYQPQIDSSKEGIIKHFYALLIKDHPTLF